MSDSKVVLTCTCDEESNCIDCEIKGQLNCRYSREAAKTFQVHQIPSMVLSVWGLALLWIMVGMWWPLLLFTAVALFNFGYLEIRCLCSHCPFYASEEGKLKCLALDGMTKRGEYKPGPMTGSDRVLMTLAVAIIVGTPILAELYMNWFLFMVPADLTMQLGFIGLTLATAMAHWQFFKITGGFFCSKCVNFSCPLNTVPKHFVDAYLNRNPVMRKAWEDADYVLG